MPHLGSRTISIALALVAFACSGATDPASTNAQQDRDRAAGPVNITWPEHARSGETCSEGVQSLSHACLPKSARAGAALRLYAEDRGCYGGGCEGVTSTRSCRVEVEGNTVRLSVASWSCVEGDPEAPRSCTSDCRNLDVTCTIPPLAAGRYRVVTTPAEWPSKETLDRELVVTEDAGEESCLDTRSPDLEPSPR